MRKILLSLMLIFAGSAMMQAQNEYSTLVVETKAGTTLQVSLKKKPQVQVSDKEFTIAYGGKVVGYVHEEVRKFYFKPYDPSSIEAPVAGNVIRIAYLDDSKVTINGVDATDKVRLYTLDGRSVAASYQVDGAAITVSIEALEPGTYILNVDNKQSFKILK